MTDIAEYVTNAKWNWAGQIILMKDKRWTTRSTEWQTKDVRAARRPHHRWRDDIVGSRNSMGKDSKGKRKMRTLAEGYFLQ